MALKLMLEGELEIRWSWEPADNVSSAHAPDAEAMRARFARWMADPLYAAALLGFLRQGDPAFMTPSETSAVVDRLTALVASGQVRVSSGAPLVVANMPGVDVADEEVADALPPPTIAEPDEHHGDDVCWPCLRAAAAAAALKNAAGSGTPFIHQN